MPTGLNLTIVFDTASDQDAENTYPFITDGGGDLPPTLLNDLDAYYGSDAAFNIHFNSIVVFSLCEYPTSNIHYNIIELNYKCPDGVMLFGSYAEADLTTYSFGIINMNLCDQVYHGNIIDLGDICGLVRLHNGSNMVVDLYTVGHATGTLHNLPLCCGYEKPPKREIEFEYTAECEGVFGTVVQSCAVADLTTYPLPKYEHDFNLCSVNPHVSPKQGMDILLGAVSDVTTLEPKFTFGSHEWVYEYEPEGGCASGALIPKFIFGSSIEVALDVEKDLDFDFPLCTEDTNPPLDYSENPNHVFKLKDDYTYLCGSFEFTCYHGSNCYAPVQESVEFLDILAFHGGYSDLDFSPFQNFQADGYSGAYGDGDLTISPAIEVSFDFYSGQYADATLFTIVVFYDIDGYSGAYGDLDLSVYDPPELPSDAYQGSYGEFEMLTEPNIQETIGYHGAYGDLDFTSFPAAKLDMDAYHGGNGVIDTIILTPQFDADAYHGSYGDLDLTDVPSAGVGDVTGYHGGYGYATMAVTLGLRDIDAYSGAEAVLNQLSYSTTFDVDMYGGEYGDLDFTETPPPTFDMDAYHGGNGVQDDMSVTKALYPRAYTGSYSDADFTDFPAQELEIVSYNGARSDLDGIENDPWNFFCYHGSNTDLSLGIQVNFGETLAYSGALSVVFDLNYSFAALDIDANFGSIGTVSDFFIPVPPSMAPNAYHGHSTYLTTDIREHAKLKVHFVHDLAMYDGMGGIGGLNHCPTTDLYYSSHYIPNDLDGPDNVIRFEYPLSGNLENYDDDLNIIFDEYGDRPYNVCNSHHNTGHMSIDLLTQQRFTAEAYHGADTKVFMKRELTAFGEVPDDILYSEDGEGGRKDHIDRTFTRDFFEFDFYDGSASAVWWEADPDSVRAWAGYSCSVEFTLIETSYDVVHDTGMFVELGVPKPSWHEFIRSATSGETGIIMDFEPVIWTRFCPGYIIPIGNNVILEFASKDNTDCEAWYATGGERAEAYLSCSYGLSATCHYGSYVVASVDLQKLWTLYARHGARMNMASNVDFSVNFRDGSNFYVKFYVPPILGYEGAHAEIDTLIVAGPAVAWITEEGCLPNDYVPLTEDGDIDYEELEPNDAGVVVYVDVPVEGWPYFTPLNATCITYDESVSEEDQ